MPRSPRPSNQLRVIGGRFRGRRLAFPDAPGLRPTPDRVRETLFNWLMPVIDGARCLDLFAGSGALGIETLSRGARALRSTNTSLTLPSGDGSRNGQTRMTGSSAGTLRRS